MSDTNNDVSDIKKAAEQVDTQQIDKNLNNASQNNTTENLSEEEQTPFIKEDLRTDK